MEKVTLNEKEQKRLVVLNKVEKEEMSTIEAAEMLELSWRHIKRLRAAYRQNGAAALAHGNRGRKPFNALEKVLKEQVLDLARVKYPGFNQLHFTEKLNECEGINVSRSSVRRILLADGLNSPRRRKAPKHRSRRPRYPQEGMMLQIDGSEHDWLEGRGPYLTLIGAIDDAVGTVPWAIFRYTEDSTGYFMLFKEIVKRKGIPLSVYHDRHSIFEVSPDKRPSIEEQLAGKTCQTQFGRLMLELGITSISALSPQAKGRIERLWGTFQDRLNSELRLAKAKTLEDAQQILMTFLKRFNSHFAVIPSKEGTAYRQPEAGFKPETIFCFKHLRTVGYDNVVRLDDYRLQLLPSAERSSYARLKVEIHQGLEGNLKVYHQNQYLASHSAPPETPRLNTNKINRKSVMVRQEHTDRGSKLLVKNHPWKQWVYR
jgi:transposase